MSQKIVIIILIVVVAVLAGTTIYLATTKNVSQPTIPTPVANTSSTLKTYKSQNYGFEFQYPNKLVITPASKENEVTISDEEGGHWIYDVRITNNSDNFTLEKILEILEKEATDQEKLVNDIILDGKPAKRYSIKNFGDYGNAGVILIVGNNILTISGDDSTTSGKADFEALLSTFKFSK